MTQEDFLLKFSDTLIPAAENLVQSFRKNLELQGHRLTGTLSESISYEFKFFAKDLIIEFYAEYYLKYVDQGVPAAKIPYSRGSGKKTSKYIEKLMDFFKKRGVLDEKEQRKAAFATANKHKAENMPTKRSAVFSATGKRTGFVNTALAESAETLYLLSDNAAFLTMEAVFNQMLDSLQVAA